MSEVHMRKKKGTRLRAPQLCPEVAASSDCLLSVLFCGGFYGGSVWTTGAGVCFYSPGFLWISLCLAWHVCRLNPAVFTRRGKWSQNKQESTLSVVFPSTPDPAGNEYDLSALSMVRKPWTAVDTSMQGKRRNFYLSVCNPLPYIPGCHGALGPWSVASLESDGTKVSLSSCTILVCAGIAVGSCMVSEDSSYNLGVVQISPQATGNGSLSILYMNGDRCGNQRFSTRIVFECAQTSVRVHLSRRHLVGRYF